MKHLPNTLTVLRIAVTPLILFGLLRGTLGGYALATVVFVAAAISDYYDGQLARRYGTHSRLGQFLDPLADKILVLGTLIVLAYHRPDLAPWWAVALVAVRGDVPTVTGCNVEAFMARAAGLEPDALAALEQLVDAGVLATSADPGAGAGPPTAWATANPKGVARQAVQWALDHPEHALQGEAFRIARHALG